MVIKRPKRTLAENRAFVRFKEHDALLHLVTVTLKRNIPSVLDLVVTDHFIDRLIERSRSPEDVTNAIVLYKRAINDRLCEMVYAFHSGHNRVIVNYGDVYLAFTTNLQKTRIQLRTIMIEPRGLQTSQKCYMIYIE